MLVNHKEGHLTTKSLAVVLYSVVLVSFIG